MRERAAANRAREAGHLDEIQGPMANTLKFSRNGAARRVIVFTLVGFIVWLGLMGEIYRYIDTRLARCSEPPATDSVDGCFVWSSPPCAFLNQHRSDRACS